MTALEAKRYGIEVIGHPELILRIAIAAVLGGIIGFERDRHGRPAGLRTHLIVAMTSATFMVISAHFAFFQGYLPETHHIEIDASRIAASVVSGIGFLAGGAILRTGATVQGLTTAGSLWLVSAIGLCSGAGMYPEAGSVTAMGLIALTVLRKFEDKNDRMLRRAVNLTLEDRSDNLGRLMRGLDQIGAVVSDFNYEKTVEQQLVSLAFDVRFPATLGVSSFIQHIEKQEGVRKVQVRLTS